MAKIYDGCNGGGVRLYFGLLGNKKVSAAVQSVASSRA